MEIGLVLPDDAPQATGDGAAVVQRARAAILANQLDEARALLDGAGRELQDPPEIRYQRARIELLAGRFAQAGTGFATLLALVPLRTARSDGCVRCARPATTARSW